MRILNAMWVDTIRHHPDGRVDLLGLFEDVYLADLPVTVESLSVYVDMGIEEGDRGRPHTLQLSLIEGATGETIYTNPVRFKVPTLEEFPRPTVQLDLSLFELTFHHWGDYWLEMRLSDISGDLGDIEDEPERSLFLGVLPQA